MTQLQQGFTTGGMGPNGHFAWQQFSGPNVRFGSKADIAERETNVRFTPKSGHLDSSSRGGSQRNMQREIGASWNRQSRQVATQLL